MAAVASSNLASVTRVIFKMKFLSQLLLGTVAAVVTANAGVNLGSLPLWFESASGGRFIAHGPDAEFVISRDGVEFTLTQPGKMAENVHMTFAGGAASSAVVGEDELAGKVNYLLGSDHSQWQSGVPTFSRVRLEQVYPGVNVIYYGNREHLEYDFNLAAGVTPETVTLRFDGAEKIHVNTSRELVVQLHGGQLIQHVPVAWQEASGERREYSANYKIVDAHTVTFTVTGYDRTRPLVIDPVLGFSTYFGGASGDKAWAVAINPADNSIFVAGQTLSSQVSNNIPFSAHGYQTNFNGGSQAGDAFVAKFDQTGTNLIYCTYLGGSEDDAAYALAVDSVGHAFVAGATDSTNFPVKNAVGYGAYSGAAISGVRDPQAKIYPADAFIAELETNGAALIYSTYLGGNSSDSVNGLDIDPVGNAYVTGFTFSTNFPSTASAYLNHLATTNSYDINCNAFVAEIAAGGGVVNYATYFGGTNYDQGTAIKFKNGKVFVAGYTVSTNFPWVNGLSSSRWLNGFATNATPGSDAFVVMFATSGTNLLLQYSTFLGSTNNDVATGIAADSAGNAYVVGWTTSTNFPVTTNSLQLSSFVRTNIGGFVIATNAFLAKISWNGVSASNAWSQMFGGLGVDVANAVALDASGNIFIAGSATSTNISVTRPFIFGSLRATNSGASDAFVTAIKSDLSALLFSAYLGGRQDDFAEAIALDSAGNAVIAGQTLSTNFPVFAPRQFVRDGTNDAFVAKILTGSSPVLQAASAGTNVLVYWPALSDVTPAVLGIETTTNLLRPAFTNWTVVTNPAPVLTNGNYAYTFTPTNPIRFFRFHQN
jgi:hypothetical protein